MDNIFEIRFSFEQKTKDEVIYKFSNKQGGDYNVFAYHWQCFVWAAIIGFLRNERRPLTPPIADKPFSLNTMMNNHGEKDAQALICLAIAKAGTLDIMKNPDEAINLINEYANGGFYHIIKLMENGENSFNDLEKVKQEIFNRGEIHENIKIREIDIVDKVENTSESKVNESTPETINPEKKKGARWRTNEVKDLISYYKGGMTIEQLAATFDKAKDNVIECLTKQGVYEQK